MGRECDLNNRDNTEKRQCLCQQCHSYIFHPMVTDVIHIVKCSFSVFQCLQYLLRSSPKRTSYERLLDLLALLWGYIKTTLKVQASTRIRVVLEADRVGASRQEGSKRGDVFEELKATTMIA